MHLRKTEIYINQNKKGKDVGCKNKKKIDTDVPLQVDISFYFNIQNHTLIVIFFRGRSWSISHCHRKWNWHPMFKSWTGHIVLMLLGKV